MILPGLFQCMAQQVANAVLLAAHTYSVSALRTTGTRAIPASGISLTEAVTYNRVNFAELIS
jgi:hypothetical protein